MDFLDPKKKKSSIIRLYIGYALMVVLIVFGALILLYASYGYGVDRKGNVVQNGLVFLDSSPSSAEVQITNDDQTFDKTVITAERLVLPGDEYNFEFLKESYRPWQRTVDLRGGKIERLTYPYLFPVDLTTKTAHSYGVKPDFTTTSPSRQWLLVQQPGNVSSFDSIDINDNENISTKRIDFPRALFPGATAKTKLNLVEWSNDNRHFLVSYVSAGVKQFVVLDRESPADSVNLNQKYSINFKQVRLRDKKFDSYYLLLRNSSLLTGDISSTSTQKILDNVQSFQPHGDDRILFVNSKDQAKTNKVVVQIWANGGQVYTIRDLPISKSYLLDMAQYKDNWLVVVGATSGRDEAYIYRNPIENIDRHNEATFSTRTMKIKDIKDISFSANTRFIAAQSGQDFVVYDVEDDRQYRYTIETKFDKPSKFSWMDGHRLIGVAKGEIIVFDFDGQNYQTLNGGIAGLPPTFNSDYKSLYSIAKTNKAKSPYALQATDMRPTEN